jgi:DNA polymerase III gamma/tau subunit
MRDLTTKYRPCSFDEVLGQSVAVAKLRSFAQMPYPTAFLFSGNSGVGKTAAAYALAHELGCNVEETELGGLYEIPSGEMNGDAVKAATRSLHYRPLMGSGWKVLIANEADRMSISAETIWLDVLEHLPGQSVIVFTTNDPDKLTRRFRDRCECIQFEERSEVLQPHIQELARRVWFKEGMEGDPPYLETLGMPTLGSFDDMHASFRLAIRQLQQQIRVRAAHCSNERTFIPQPKVPHVQTTQETEIQQETPSVPEPDRKPARKRSRDASSTGKRPQAGKR